MGEARWSSLVVVSGTSGAKAVLPGVLFWDMVHRSLRVLRGALAGHV
jgi:hypothetical protein